MSVASVKQPLNRKYLEGGFGRKAPLSCLTSSGLSGYQNEAAFLTMITIRPSKPETHQ